MKKGVQKLWAELGKAQKPAKLSKQGRGVKLSKVDDAQQAYDELNDSYSELSYFVQEVLPDLEDKMSEIYSVLDEYFINGSMRYVPEAAENLRDALTAIEASASDLGMDADFIYDEFDDAMRLVDDAENAIDEAKREYSNSRVSRASNFDIPL